MMRLEPCYVVCGRTGPLIVVYRARRRGVWGRAVMLTLAFYALLITAAISAELPWWIPPAQWTSPVPPLAQPIIPATSCPPGTELYLTKCRSDCRFGPCMRKRLA
jgi:hypothetical protein